ncbi:MAG: molecular chaperone, partial [Gammaproteobacteria bacterium]|nr:molecular chaperone [Gammaproteobacteria bacterium]
MRNVDLSPLYRSFIGFDHLASLLDNANRTEKSNGYPPYNI